jgi:hypothetical protein
MNRQLIILGAVTLVAAAFLCPRAHSQGDSKKQIAQADSDKQQTHQMGQTFGSHLEPILKVIEAKPEQRKQITEILEDFRPKIQPLKVKFKTVQEQFLTSMTSGRPAEEIMLKQEEMNEIYGRIVNEYCAMHLKMRRCMNPTQCARYEKYRLQQGWTH